MDDDKPCPIVRHDEDKLNCDLLRHKIATLERKNKGLQQRLEQKDCLITEIGRRNRSHIHTIIMQTGKVERLRFSVFYSAITLFIAGLFLGINSC